MSNLLIDILDLQGVELPDNLKSNGVASVTHKTNKMTEWLRTNFDYLSLNGIETQLGIPYGTLSKAVTGARPLPKKWIPVLEKLKKELSK